MTNANPPNLNQTGTGKAESGTERVPGDISDPDGNKWGTSTWSGTTWADDSTDEDA